MKIISHWLHLIMYQTNELYQTPNPNRQLFIKEFVLPTKLLLLARLRLQSVHIVVVGSRRLNIYFYHAQGGQRNISVISVTALTSKMYFRTT